MFAKKSRQPLARLQKDCLTKNYITRDEVYNSEPFFTIPKSLFTDKYKTISNTARFLYAILFDRSKLSKKNHFMDNEHKAFVFFTRKEAAAMLGVSDRTISKAFKELSDSLLIEDVKQGKKKVNKIYILHPAETKKDEAKTKKRIENRKAMLKKKQETLKKLNTSIKIKKTILEKVVLKQEKYKNMHLNKKDLIISPTLLHDIKNQIEYDYFTQNGHDINVTKETIDILILAIAEMNTAQQTKIGAVFYTKEQLKHILDELDSSMVIDFLPDFYDRINLCEIRDLKAYMKASIVNYIQNLKLSFSKMFYNTTKQNKKCKPSYNLEQLMFRSPLYIPDI